MKRWLHVAWIAATLMVFCGTATATDNGNDRQKAQNRSGAVNLRKGKANTQAKGPQVNARFDASSRGKTITPSQNPGVNNRMSHPDRVVKMNPRFVSYLEPMRQSRNDDRGNNGHNNYYPSRYPNFNWGHHGGHHGICRPAFNHWCQRECGDTSPSSGCGSKRWGHHCTPGKMKLCNVCGFLD